MNFKGKDCVIHVPQHLAGMDKHVDNSCKRRAEYLRRSLVIVCRKRGQWQASSIQQKSACFVGVSVMESEHAQTVCTRLFSPRPRTSLGARLLSCRLVSAGGVYVVHIQYMYVTSVTLKNTL